MHELIELLFFMGIGCILLPILYVLFVFVDNVLDNLIVRFTR